MANIPLRLFWRRCHRYTNTYANTKINKFSIIGSNHVECNAVFVIQKMTNTCNKHVLIRQIWYVVFKFEINFDIFKINVGIFCSLFLFLIILK